MCVLGDRGTRTPAEMNERYVGQREESEGHAAHRNAWMSTVTTDTKIK